jgi:hypothetical protein
MSSSSSKRRRTRPDDVPPEGAADDTPVAAATVTPGTPVAEPVETVGSKKRVVVQRAKDADIFLAQCRKLHAELIAKAAATDNVAARAIPDGIPSNIVEVAELPEAQVLEGMEVIALQVAHQVLSKKGFSMEVPSRAASNQVYVKEWDRIVRIGGRNRNWRETSVSFSLTRYK